MNRLYALLIVSTLSLPAFATDVACWNRDLERIDTYGNPPSRGDNNFFTFTVSGTANVTMLYPGTQSMRGFPLTLYEIVNMTGDTLASVTTPAGSGKGCMSAKLNNLPYFMPGNAKPPAAPSTIAGRTYDPYRRYPDPETTYAGGGGLTARFEPSTYTCSATDCRTDNNGGRAWQFRSWPANDTGTMHTSAGASCGTYGASCGTIDAECAAATGSTTSLDYQDCQICVRTRGYWLNYNKLVSNPSYTGPDAMVAKGNWLNFFPPKWALLRLAYKRLVNGPLLNPLREGIVTNCTQALGCAGGNSTLNGTSAAAGEYRLQKMLPQSCNGAGRPSQRIASVDPVTYNATTNPLAEMLFNTAWTVSSNAISAPPANWSFFTAQVGASPALSTHPGSEPGVSGQVNSKDGFCPGCNSGFSILFTDGRGLDGLRACDSSQYTLGTLDPAFPAYCRDSSGAVYDSKAACSDTTGSRYPGLGAEDDGNDYLNPTLAGGASAVMDFNAHRTSPPAGVCPNDPLDLVARWMYRNNMYPPQPGTNLRLYAIGIGTNYNGKMNAPTAAASAGGGRTMLVTDFGQLENAINSVFHEIISTATSFSVAAITTVQTRGTTFAFIPRFRPLLGSQWEGRLFRFKLFNEFAAGCSQIDLTGGPDGGPQKNQYNPNGNNSCNDLYLTDADGGFVGEDETGNFVLLDTSQPYTDAGWPLRSPPVLARPVWEAAEILECREGAWLSGSSTTCDDGGTAIAARNLLTVPLDAGMPSTPTALIPFNDFSDAGVEVMTNYMKFSGVNSEFCQSMALATRSAYAAKEDCGRDVMRFMEGQDVLGQASDGGLVRPNILGDIFHSSPILITPPVPSFLCETGIVTQCVRTLYAEDGTPNGATPNSKQAYTDYYNAYLRRQQLILVGSNDGMLHAFQAGTYQGDAGYDEGTGVEVWAFIPPDMLPKLQRYVMGGTHSILVDGSPWVRDVWVDGSGSSVTPNNRKEADEFHTVAILGERGGGRHWTALDVTDTNAPDAGVGGPRFLWTFPPVGSNIELTAGESWNDTTPNPPPIGPILMADSSGPLQVVVGGTTYRAKERWVVAINGGYDPNLIRGRAIYIVDAWTGELLFKFSRYDTTTNTDPRFQLGPVASPISMIDSNYDNFFDLAVVGDTEGKLWTIDMLKPGGTLASPTWFGAMTFKQTPGSNGYLSERSPFFGMPGARVFDDSKGGVRVYLGSGDRDQIRVRDTDTADGGTCQIDNLRGCIRNNCTVDVNQDVFQIGTGGTTQSFTGRWRYDPNSTTLTTNTFSSAGTTNSAGACSDPAQMDVRYQVSCPGGNNMVDIGDGGTTVIDSVYCDFDGGNDAGEECPDTSGKPIGTAVAFNPQTVTNSRFYSIKLFTPTDATTRPRMVDSSSQSTYQAHPLTDGNLANADADGGMSSLTQAGWFVQHARDSNEKTASGALLLGGCVAWNTLVPQNTNSSDGGQCGSGFIPASTAFLYQANDDTGVVQCGLEGSNTQLATVRYQQRQVTETVPQQPTPVVSLNARTGQAGYSGVSLEPGGRIPLQVSVGAASVQGDVSWLDVSRNLHACRHPDGGVTDGGACNF